MGDRVCRAALLYQFFIISCRFLYRLPLNSSRKYPAGREKKRETFPMNKALRITLSIFLALAVAAILVGFGFSLGLAQ